jgi:hypothetical protein
MRVSVGLLAILACAVMVLVPFYFGVFAKCDPEGDLSAFRKLRLGIMLRSYRLDGTIREWDVDYTGAISAVLVNGDGRETWTVTDDRKFGNPLHSSE